MSNKISYASVIADVLNGEPLTDERIEKLTALKASLEKRASRKAGPTKVQQKVGPICRKLVSAGRLTEGKVKGKVTYSLA